MLYLRMDPNNAVKPEMSHIKVRCLNSGCSWHGYFRDYEDHASQCPYQQAQCSQCGNSLPQLELAEHMTKTCPKKPVNCRHYGEMITNAAVSPKDHQDNECPNKKWTCPLDGQMVEDNINQHVTQLEERINNMSGSETLHLTHPLQSTADKMNLPLSDNGMQGQYVASSEMQMRVRQLEVKTDTFEGIVTTLHRDIEQCITTLETIDRQRKLDNKTIESQERKIQSLERMLAIRDMTIMDLDARIQSLEYASYDGILLWRIPEFSKHRLEAQRGKTLSIYSPAFYTSRTGYKMCIRMYPNGDGMGKGSHMSLSFIIMSGPYDALLSWPSMQRVTFMLINQNNREHVIDSFRPDPASSSFKRPTSDMNIASGCPLFIPHKCLDDPSYGYIKEDTMYIKTVVDTANLPLLNDNNKPADISSTKKHTG